MTDPLDKATSKAPATLGEGCLSRFDPDELDSEDGTWKQEQAKPETAAD